MLWGTPQVWWVSEARVPPHQYHWPVMMHMAFAFCTTKTIKDTRIVTSLVFSSSGRQKSVVCVLMVDVWKYGISASPCPCFVTSEDKHVWSITECSTEEISKILILKFLQCTQLEMPLSTALEGFRMKLLDENALLPFCFLECRVWADGCTPFTAWKPKQMHAIWFQIWNLVLWFL